LLSILCFCYPLFYSLPPFIGLAGYFSLGTNGNLT